MNALRSALQKDIPQIRFLYATSKCPIPLQTMGGHAPGPPIQGDAHRSDVLGLVFHSIASGQRPLHNCNFQFPFTWQSVTWIHCVNKCLRKGVVQKWNHPGLDT